ncbi:MAG: hypothetical protein V7735_06390 [Photobacterium frigidiphilum]|uniref:hypothetical protein n=1 Tax=Photobacterium frigidiphilum TaxID=264736 RepID=UPI00300354ED
MIKKLVLASSLLFSTFHASATAPLSAGLFLGSPTSGITAKYQDDYKFAVGLDTFSVSADVMWNLGEVTARTQYSPLYTFVGLQWVDDSEKKWGPRAGLGLEVPFLYFHLYAEAGTTWYVDDSSMELEGAAGVRFNL